MDLHRERAHTAPPAAGGEDIQSESVPQSPSASPQSPSASDESPQSKNGGETPQSKSGSPQAKTKRSPLQQLIAEHKTLLADFAIFRSNFNILVNCLEENGIAVPPILGRTCGAPPASACAENILATPRLAKCIFATAGQAGWSAAMLASTGAKLACEAVKEEKLFVDGGAVQHTFSGTVSSSECLDIRSGKWEAETDIDGEYPAHTGRFGHVGAVVGRSMYVCGGQGKLGRSVIRFDAATLRWKTEAPMNVPRAFAASAVVNGNLYVVMGSHGLTVWDCLERFQPAGADGKGTWVRLQGKSGHRRSHALAALRGKLLLCGGCSEPHGGRKRPDVAYARTAQLLSVTDEVTSEALPVMTLPRSWHAAVSVHGKVLVCGGSVPGTGRVMKSVESYDPWTNAWAEVLRMPRACGGHSAVVVAGKLYIVGGSARDQSGCPSESCVQRMDLVTCNWEEVEPMKRGRACFYAAVITRGPTEAAWDSRGVPQFHRLFG